MIHFIIKLIVCPTVVYLSDLLFRSVEFSTSGQILLVGWTLSIAAYIADVALLERYGNILQTIIDFVVAISIIMIYQYFLPAAVVTFSGALITALLLAVTEYAAHVWLLQRKKNYTKS
ncbi:MAG: hypothetical protein PWP27_806 [Clostridiales bacterium]|jgi:hypothetical protein|nr:hypothetical protein [Clostridiales bacterium]MDK2932996.1 hypothetical protein [Clostridiales bacterium]